MKSITFIPLILSLLFFSCTKNENKTSDNTPKQDTTTTGEAAHSLSTSAYTMNADTTGLISKTGRLNYSGNEPFVQPTLFVSGSEAYILKGDSVFMESTFDNLNGKPVTLYGKITTSGTSRHFEIYYYQLREQ